MLGLITDSSIEKGSRESKTGFDKTNQEATVEIQVRYDGGIVESADSRIREVLRNI